MRKSSDKSIFNPHCIFCDVAQPIRVSVRGKRVFHKTWLFEYSGGQGVIDIAYQHQDEKLLCHIWGQSAPREQSCIWIMYTDVSDFLQMSLHMQPWHPAGAWGCRLCLSHRTSATESDHHRLLSNCLQWVLSEKNYAKFLWCLKAVSEGLECLLFTTFMNDLVQNSPHHTSNIAAPVL